MFGIVAILLDEGPRKLSLIPGKGQSSFIFQRHTDLLLGPPSVVLSVCLSSFSEVKRAGLQIKHSSPSSVDLKNVWSYSSMPTMISWHVKEHIHLLFYIQGAYKLSEGFAKPYFHK